MVFILFDNQKSLFCLKLRVMKIKVAFQGIYYALKHEVHALATLCVVLFAYVLRVSAWEWTVLLVCIGMVLCAELLNSALEKICDTLHPERAEGIKHVKDMAAGAVLVVAIVSALIALLIFTPYLSALIQ